MDRAPNYWKIYDLFNYGKTVDAVLEQRPDGRWQPARPMGYNTLRRRLKLAFRVFKGELDVLEWDWCEDNQAYCDEKSNQFFFMGR